MRYRLSVLLTAITLLAVALAMWVAHGAFGLVLALPHLSAVMWIMLFVRGRRPVVAIGGALLYATCWFATWWWGASGAYRETREYLSEALHGEEPRQLDHDPVRQSLDFDSPKPWVYVGQAYSPAPFIVALDYGWSAGWRAGSGGRLYWFWFFGHWQFLREWSFWSF